ncbi:ATP-binding cassette domain-containing protein [Rhodoferax sp.]|uniref:ATP-binding cassette domain-containing protein n=1 Tax=Rhodoferax sp. TaxID=50421 RepID=UPI002ACF04E5|nr:ATP-binding cassette domain-containing protein [Rhodoferax sp.]MDZ7920331.1 ATP-binding cassette domain-containing protein [Rhodoferax sp.]
MSLHIHITRLATPATTLVQNLELRIAPGTVHTLMGDSGSGKSSVLAAVCGTLDEALQCNGTVTLNGQHIDTLPTQARKVGILFQEDLLFAHMTVRENLLFAVPAGPQPAREAAVLAALSDVEMTPALHADPATLSGGQRARVALARALLAQPQALLLDEPFSKLDAALRNRMRTLVFGLVQSRQIPALLVTHDAADVADAQCLTQLRPPSPL